MLRIDPNDYHLYPAWDMSQEAERHRLMLRARAQREAARERGRARLQQTHQLVRG
jgi:regulator of protease activity HflC (stomatin/prohibitin superfamily)